MEGSCPTHLLLAVPLAPGPPSTQPLEHSAQAKGWASALSLPGAFGTAGLPAWLHVAVYRQLPSPRKWLRCRQGAVRSATGELQLSCPLTAQTPRDPPSFSWEETSSMQRIRHPVSLAKHPTEGLPVTLKRRRRRRRRKQQQQQPPEEGLLHRSGPCVERPPSAQGVGPGGGASLPRPLWWGKGASRPPGSQTLPCGAQGPPSAQAPWSPVPPSRHPGSWSHPACPGLRRRMPAPSPPGPRNPGPPAGRRSPLVASGRGEGAMQRGQHGGRTVAGPHPT